MNRKDIDCNVIIDLLPLYKEEICSEATRELVEEHLRSCEDCRQLCENMTLPEPEKKAVPDEAETFKKVGKKVKRGKFYRRALILIFAVFAALNVAWLKLKFFPYKEFSADMGEYNGDCYQVCEGGYYYNVVEPHYLSFFDGKLYIWKEIAGKEGNVSVLTVIPRVTGDTKYAVAIKTDSEYMEIPVTDSIEFDPSGYKVHDNDEHAKQVLNDNREEIEELMEAAQKKWGEYLK